MYDNFDISHVKKSALPIELLSFNKRLDSNQHLTMTNQILEKYIALYYIYSTTTNPMYMCE